MQNELNLEEEILVVNFGGKKMELRYPSVSEKIEYEKEYAKIKEGETDALFDFYVNQMVKLGADAQLIKSLSMKNFIKIMNALSGEEKKS